MALLVLGELCLLLEALATVAAPEGLVARVDPQVVPQVAALVELATAHAAYEDGVEPVCEGVHSLPLSAEHTVHVDAHGPCLGQMVELLLLVEELYLLLLRR
jgi:hypothetical protein